MLLMLHMLHMLLLSQTLRLPTSGLTSQMSLWHGKGWGDSALPQEGAGARLWPSAVPTVVADRRSKTGPSPGQLRFEIWRKNPNRTRWLKRSKLKIIQAVIDPYWEIGDTEIENNYYPTRLIPARLKPRASRSNPKNLMQDLLNRNKKITKNSF